MSEQLALCIAKTLYYKAKPLSTIDLARVGPRAVAPRAKRERARDSMAEHDYSKKTTPNFMGGIEYTLRLAY